VSERIVAQKGRRHSLMQRRLHIDLPLQLVVVFSELIVWIKGCSIQPDSTAAELHTTRP